MLGATVGPIIVLEWMEYLWLGFFFNVGGTVVMCSPHAHGVD